MISCANIFVKQIVQTFSKNDFFGCRGQQRIYFKLELMIDLCMVDFLYSILVMGKLRHTVQLISRKRKRQQNYCLTKALPFKKPVIINSVNSVYNKLQYFNE